MHCAFDKYSAEVSQLERKSMVVWSETGYSASYEVGAPEIRPYITLAGTKPSEVASNEENFVFSRHELSYH